jgi:hypothetical protein
MCGPSASDRTALYVNGVLGLERGDDTVTQGVGLGAGEGETGLTGVFESIGRSANLDR